MECSLVIDTGTSSMRGVVFSQEHKIIYNLQKRYFMCVSKDQFAEQDANTYRSNLEEILIDCGAFAEKQGANITRIALTAQRSSLLSVDQAGNPLAPIIMWYDKRPQKICDELNEKYGNEIYDTTGMYSRTMFSAPKMYWLNANCNEIYEKAYKLVGIQDYMIFLLTGEWVTDLSFASRTNLLDLRKQNWSKRMLDIFGIDDKKLCSLIPVGKKVGELHKKYSSFHGYAEKVGIFSAGGDQQCSAIGQGLYGKQQIGITNGTASYVVALTDKLLLDKERAVHVNVGAIPGTWINEVSNMGTGSVYDWLRKLLYEDGDSIGKINKVLETTQVGAGGVIAFPYLAGKGMPEWNQNKYGEILNLRLSSTKADVARAVLEGITFEISDCYKRVEGLTGIPEQILSSGGLSELPLFNQMLSDMTGRIITTASVKETTAMGAYIVMLLSCEEINKTQINSILLHKKGIQYNPNERNTEKYAKMREQRNLIECRMPFEIING